MSDRLPDLVEFITTARTWLEANAALRPERDDSAWGGGSDDVSVFRDLDRVEERALLEAAMEWQRRKFDAGWGAIGWPAEHGGSALPARYEQAFVEEEARFVTPPGHELFNVTLRLVAPTVAAFGTPEQQRRLVRRFLRTEELCCQLFSEPGAGSDLAGVATRAVRDGDEWILTGQKVWSSGAQFAHWGEAVCRTDFDVPKHAGITVFLVPMNAPGVTVRPIRQMTGGASFNEVFLDEVRVPDALRLGAVNQGWRVTLATLAFERAAASYQTHDRIGGSWPQVVALARWLGVTGHPIVRQQLTRLFALDRIREFTALRTAAAAQAGEPPGPAGSIGKLQWTLAMTEISDVVTSLLGPRLAADTGEWGTFAWTAHLLGAHGYRIAGGSDEIQRNILGERVLGLPGEPRTDRDVPFRRVPRSGGDAVSG